MMVFPDDSAEIERDSPDRGPDCRRNQVLVCYALW